MATENKYGTITTERGSIPPGEPVFLLRAQDRLALSAIGYYREICQSNGAPAEHLDGIDHAMARFAHWQMDHQDRVKTPGTSG